MKTNKPYLFFLYQIPLCSFLFLSGMNQPTMDEFREMAKRGQLEMSIDAELLINSSDEHVHSYHKTIPIRYQSYGNKIKACVITKTKNCCVKNTKTGQEIPSGPDDHTQGLWNLPLSLFEQNQNNTIHTTAQVDDIYTPDYMMCYASITPSGKYTPTVRGHSSRDLKNPYPVNSYFLPLTINLVNSNDLPFLAQLEPYKEKFLKEPILIAYNIDEVKMAIDEKRITKIPKEKMDILEALNLRSNDAMFAQILIMLQDSNIIKLKHDKHRPKTYQDRNKKSSTFVKIKKLLVEQLLH